MSETTLDLDKLIVINQNIAVNDTLMTGSRLFQHNEQYQFTRTVCRMEGCNCSGGQEERCYYEIECAGKTYLVRDLMVTRTRDIRRPAGNVKQVLNDRVLATPNGGFDQFMHTPNNYNPREELARFNAMARDGSKAAWNKFKMDRQSQ